MKDSDGARTVRHLVRNDPECTGIAPGGGLRFAVRRAVQRRIGARGDYPVRHLKVAILVDHARRRRDPKKAGGRVGPDAVGRRDGELRAVVGQIGADKRVGRAGRAGNVDAVAAPLIGDRKGSERARGERHRRADLHRHSRRPERGTRRKWAAEVRIGKSGSTPIADDGNDTERRDRGDHEASPPVRPLRNVSAHVQSPADV